MADDFDAPALLAALDATEEAGVPPHLVERLRELVGLKVARLARNARKRARKKAKADQAETDRRTRAAMTIERHADRFPTVNVQPLDVETVNRHVDELIRSLEIDRPELLLP